MTNTLISRAFMFSSGCCLCTVLMHDLTATQTADLLGSGRPFPALPSKMVPLLLEPHIGLSACVDGAREPDQAVTPESVRRTERRLGVSSYRTVAISEEWVTPHLARNSMISGNADSSCQRN